jgi:hypothetical protein
MRRMAPTALLILAVISVRVSPLLGAPADPSIIVEGKVLGIEPVSSSDMYTVFDVGLELEFRNPSGRAIILLKPSGRAQVFWLGTVRLALARFLALRAQPSSFIWDQSIYPSVSIGGEFTEMVKQLDSPRPPKELTVVIGGHESWKWSTSARLTFYSRTMSSVYSGADLPFEIIGQIRSPLWMRLTYLTWPDNLSRADRRLAKKLTKRWTSFGLLYTSRTLTTQPIEIRLFEIARQISQSKQFGLPLPPNTSFQRTAHGSR